MPRRYPVEFRRKVLDRHWSDLQARTRNVGQAIQRSMREIKKPTRTLCMAFSATSNGQTRIACRTGC